MSETKPCPICGSKHTEQHEYILSGKPWWMCRECGYTWDIKGTVDFSDVERMMKANGTFD